MKKVTQGTLKVNKKFHLAFRDEMYLKATSGAYGDVMSP